MPEDRESALTLDQMREMREVSGVLYKKFTEAYRYFATHAFCFYEGEDGKYYNSRIEQYWGSNYIPLIAGNKKEVLRALRKITSDPLYRKVCVMFFVDRDYDESLSGTNKHLFETPCYSIENLYANEVTFDRILRAEFGITITDEDYQKCKDVYHQRSMEFNKVILPFNAVVKYQHVHAPDIRCQFSTVKTSLLANISINQVKKSTNHDATVGALVGKLAANNETLARFVCEFDNEADLSMVLRGKNQLDFLVTLITKLKEANSSGGFFTEKRKCVRINITDNRLGELSQYALTPSELTAFLLEHSPN